MNTYDDIKNQQALGYERVKNIEEAKYYSLDQDYLKKLQ